MRAARPAARVASLAILLALFATPAFAEASMGERIKAAMDDMVGPLMFVVSLLSTLGGAILFIKGLLKLKDAHQGQGEIKAAFVSIFCATCLIALPEAAGMGMMSMMGTNNIFFSTSDLSLSDVLDGNAAASQSKSLSSTVAGIASAQGVTQCYNGGGVPCMAKNLAVNVVPVAIIATFAFAYIAGLWGFGSSLFEMARHSGERGGGSPPGFWTKVAASIALLAAPPVLTALSQSVMGDPSPVGLRGLNTGSSFLTYEGGGGGSNILKQYAELIGYLFHIAALFGVIAFVKGIFILKGAGEQRQNATYSHGIVFMVAGVLLANAKLSTCTLLGTIVGFGNQGNLGNVMGFCSG